MGVRKGQVSVGVGGLLGYAKRRIWVTTSKGERFFAPTWLGPRSPAGPFGSFDFPLRRAQDRLWTNGGEGGAATGGLGDVLEGWGEWSRFPPARE